MPSKWKIKDEREDTVPEAPRNLPKYCGQCGKPLTQPRAIRWQGIDVEPISGLNPTQYPRKEGSLDELIFHWHLYCTNERCRHYQAFNLGGVKWDEGRLDKEEFADLVKKVE